MELFLLREVVIIFCLSTIVIYVCSKVKIPPVVGFLITGVVCGPYGLGLVNAIHEVETLAEVGVVLLMFSIGMELSVSELIRLRKPVFVGGGLQVALTTGAFAGLSMWWGITPGASILIGFMATLSSTAIVLKILQQQGQMESPHGRITLSILIAQDLVVVPMMLAVPLLASGLHAGAANGGQQEWLPLIWSGLKPLLIIGVLFFTARKIVPIGLAMVVRTRSRELFLIATLGICFSIAWITSKLGLSLSLGAFLAGLIMSESEYSHSALEGVLPFRDVFTSLFFTSVGMLLNLGFAVGHLWQVGLMTIALIVVSAVIAGLVTRLLGYPLRPAIIVALGLCQVGEFAFVLAKEGVGYKLLSMDQYQYFLAVSILSMAAAPFLMVLAPQIADFIIKKILRLHAGDDVHEEQAQSGALHDHLIIIGFGIGGKYLARAAKMAGIQYTILEMNPDTVRKYAAKGEPIAYGDATHPAVLRSLGLAQARVLAIVISDPAAVRGITEAARHMSPSVHILVRTRFLGEVAALKALGASDVIPEELETAVEIFARVLGRYLVPRGDIEHFVNEVRAENYEMFRKLDLPGTTLCSLPHNMPNFSVAAIAVEAASPLDGTTLQDTNLRQKANMTVIAVCRGTETFANPGGDFRLQAADVAYVFATPDDVTDASALFAAYGK